MDNLQSKKWQKGDPIFINRLQWGKPELDKIEEVMKGDWFGGNSKFNTEFENRMKQFSGNKYFQTTNSGSAAIQTAILTLLHLGKIKAGDKVLHPIGTFPTSISSSIMSGLIPVYADVDIDTFVISDEGIEKAFAEHPDIALAVIPALLGNVPNIELLKQKLGDKPLILDSCDVMGSKWDGKEVGFYGDFSCYSFYGSHTISTFGVGGGLGTNNDEYYRIAKSIVFWGRDFSTDSLSPVENFLKRYSYETIGLDAQMTAVQSAFGLAQMERLPEYIGAREAMFTDLQKLFGTRLDYFYLPRRVSDRADVSWFCYPLVLKKDAPFTREEFVQYLLENKIEIRPIMAGNLLNFEVYNTVPHYVVGETPNADEISRRGFFIPLCPMDSDQKLEYIKILARWLGKF